MMLGLCAILGNRYQIRSNRESGLGRFDIQLKPLVKGIPGFLFEFKHTNDDHVDLDALADRALQQIDAKKYDTELRDAFSIIMFLFYPSLLTNSSYPKVFTTLHSPFSSIRAMDGRHMPLKVLFFTME